MIDAALVLVAVLLLEHLYHCRVGQGGGVAQGAAFSHVAQQAAHNLAAALYCVRAPRRANLRVLPEDMNDHLQEIADRR